MNGLTRCYEQGFNVTGCHVISLDIQGIEYPSFSKHITTVELSIYHHRVNGWVSAGASHSLFFNSSKWFPLSEYHILIWCCRRWECDCYHIPPIYHVSEVIHKCGCANPVISIYSIESCNSYLISGIWLFLQSNNEVIDNFHGVEHHHKGHSCRRVLEIS